VKIAVGPRMSRPARLIAADDGEASWEFFAEEGSRALHSRLLRGSRKVVTPAPARPHSLARPREFNAPRNEHSTDGPAHGKTGMSRHKAMGLGHRIAIGRAASTKESLTSPGSPGHFPGGPAQSAVIEGQEIGACFLLSPATQFGRGRGAQLGRGTRDFA